MATRSEHHTVPLSVLLRRELANEKIECPELVHGHAYQSKKGEDFILIKTERQRVLGDGVSTYSVFGVWFFLVTFIWFVYLLDIGVWMVTLWWIAFASSFVLICWLSFAFVIYGFTFVIYGFNPYNPIFKKLKNDLYRTGMGVVDYVWDVVMLCRK